MNGFKHSQCGDNLGSTNGRNLENPEKIQIFWKSFDRGCLLTTEPFGSRVMNVKVWTENILHGHFFHEGEVVVLTCEEIQTDRLSFKSDLTFQKRKLSSSISHVGKINQSAEARSEPPTAELWICRRLCGRRGIDPFLTSDLKMSSETVR